MPKEKKGRKLGRPEKLIPPIPGPLKAIIKALVKPIKALNPRLVGKIPDNSHIFTLLPRLLLWLLGGSQWLSSPSITEGELRMLIDEAHAEGIVEPTEADMLEKVFHFGDRQVQEIMTPRTEIVWVEKGTTLDEFLSTYSKQTHTRLPVYQGDMENIVGILSVKDLIQTMSERALRPDSEVSDVLRPANFVPETKPVGELFSELWQAGQQMAIVIDQFGGVAGLVTLKRLLEVIVGARGRGGRTSTRGVCHRRREYLRRRRGHGYSGGQRTRWVWACLRGITRLWPASSLIAWGTSLKKESTSTTKTYPWRSRRWGA